MKLAVRVAALAAVLLVGFYYRWQVRAAGNEIVWGEDLPGYYNYLTRGLTGGHLYLPLEPAAELLAKPNPWDPAVDNSLKLYDAVLFERRYYLYHGIGPALMAFLPWRLATGRDLPENAAILGFCFVGYLFAAGTLAGILRAAGTKQHPAAVFAAYLALGVCQCVPFLLNRVWVDEVAIAAGYCCVSAGLFFLCRYLYSKRLLWLIPAGLFFGLAIACRPHLGLFGACAMALALWRDRLRGALRFATPFAVVCLGVCLYNYQRFHDPFEFGTRYLLGGANQTEVHLKTSNVANGLSFLLTLPPEVDPIFPWFHARPRPLDLPATYTLEPIIGAIFLAPFLLALVVGARAGPGLSILWLMTLSGAGIVAFLSATGWSVQRYQVDFLPHFALVALVCALTRWPGWATVLLIVPGMAVSLALGITGPYNEMLRNKPARFVRIAGWFSPVERFRPQLNPLMWATFDRPPERPEGTKEILITAGPAVAKYQLTFLQVMGKPTLVSEYGMFGVSKITRELPPATGTLQLQAAYSSVDGTMRVRQNGALVVEHKFGPFVSAPSEMTTAR